MSCKWRHYPEIFVFLPLNSSYRHRCKSLGSKCIHCWGIQIPFIVFRRMFFFYFTPCFESAHLSMSTFRGGRSISLRISHRINPHWITYDGSLSTSWHFQYQLLFSGPSFFSDVKAGFSNQLFKDKHLHSSDYEQKGNVLEKLLAYYRVALISMRNGL